MRHAWSFGGCASGEALVAWAPDSRFLAVVGCERRAVVLNHAGARHDSFALPREDFPFAQRRRSCARTLAWSADKKILAVVPHRCRSVALWRAAVLESWNIEVCRKADEVTCVAWAPLQQALAIGTSGGDVLCFDTALHSLQAVANVGPGAAVACLAYGASWFAVGDVSKQVTLFSVSQQTGLPDQALQVLSFGRPPRALYLMSVKGAGGGAAAWQPHAANGGAAAESQMPPPGAVPILAAVFDAAVHIRTLGADRTDPPLDVLFGPDHGGLAAHAATADADLLLGFAAGTVTQVTTQLQGGQLACHTAEVLDVSSADGHDGGSGGGGRIRALAFCRALGRAAVLSGDTLHTFLPDPKAGGGSGDSHLAAFAFSDVDAILHMDWAADGSMCGITTEDGVLHVLSATPALVGASGGGHAAVLTSLQEVSIFDVLALPGPTLGHSGTQPAAARPETRLRLQHAVSALALSDTHLAAASGSEVSVYCWGRATASPLLRLRFDDPVSEVHLQADCLAVLSAGQLFLQTLAPSAGQDQGLQRPLPALRHVRTACLSSSGAVFAELLSGRLVVCCCDGTQLRAPGEDMAPPLRVLSAWSHDGPALLQLVPQQHTTRLLAEDAAGAVHVYDAAAGHHADVALPQPASAAAAMATDRSGNSRRGGHDGSAIHSPRWSLLWDAASTSTFVVADISALHVMRCLAAGGGSGQFSVQRLALQDVDGSGGGLWLCLRNGVLLRQAASGELEATVLETHTALQVRDPVAADGAAALRQRMLQAQALGRADLAAQAALLLHDTATFRQLRQASCSVHGAVAEAAALMPLLAAFY